jgi:hypothetical protein
MAEQLRVLELPNRIRMLDEKTPLQIDQNFEEVAYAVSKIQKYLNDYVVGAIDDSSEFEKNAITHGPGDPVD